MLASSKPAAFALAVLHHHAHTASEQGVLGHDELEIGGLDCPSGRITVASHPSTLVAFAAGLGAAYVWPLRPRRCGALTLARATWHRRLLTGFASGTAASTALCRPRLSHIPIAALRTSRPTRRLPFLDSHAPTDVAAVSPKVIIRVLFGAFLALARAVGTRVALHGAIIPIVEVTFVL